METVLNRRGREGKESLVSRFKPREDGIVRFTHMHTEPHEPSLTGKPQEIAADTSQIMTKKLMDLPLQEPDPKRLKLNW